MRKKRLVKNGVFASLLTLTTALPASSFVQADAVNTANTVQVIVNASASIAKVPKTALGVNTAVWNPDLSDPKLPSLLKTINVSMLRYPGGSTSDVYHWANNTIDGGYANPNDGFDNFMKMSNASGTHPIITVNAGSGTAEEAANWVKYSNITQNYGVQYWEIGNEEYGSWENGNHANNPAGYAKEAESYIKAMKAIDPSIKIGVDLIAPGTGEDDWNSTVMNTMKNDGVNPDFAIVHWYAQQPGGETDAGLLSSTALIPTMMDTLKTQLGDIPVFVTETNSVNYNPGKQSTSLVNALFLDDDITNWIQAGAQNVDWWDLYNGMVTPSQGANTSDSLYGQYNYGDYGLLSVGTGSDGQTEPPLDTPFPSYYGYQMLGAIVQQGSTFVGAGSSNDNVAVHATKLQNGDLAVMLINKDSKNSYNVNLNLEGYLAQGAATELSYGENSKSVSQAAVPYIGSVEVAPYSVTDLILKSQNGHQPNGPQVTDKTTVSDATIKPSHTQTITTTFTDTRAELNNATLEVEIYNPSGQIVGQKTVKNVSFKPGQTADPVSFDWDVPNVPGAYTVQSFVFSNDGANTVLADQSAASFTVTQPDPVKAGDVTVKTTLSTASVKVGQPVTITTTYTNTSKTDWLSNGILCQQVHDAAGNNVIQFAPNATIAPGQTVTETATFTPTAAGAYIFPVGLFTGQWGFIQWYQDANTPSLTVTN